MPRPYSMSRRADAVRRTRLAVEAALIRLLAAKPFGAVTMADIAREANVAPRTVQRHYGTKDRLLAACLRTSAQLVPEELRNWPQPASAREATQQLVDATFAVYARHSPEVWAALIRALDVPDLAETLRVEMEARTARIADLIRHGPDAWAVERELALRTILAMTSYLSWRAFTEFGGFSTAHAAQAVADLLCRSLLRERADPPAPAAPGRAPPGQDD